MNTIKSIIGAVLLITIYWVSSNVIHKVDDTEWQAVQYMSGEVEIKETAGIYWAFFPKITEYDRNVGFEFRAPKKDEDKEKHPDESIRVTFNDGGTADIDSTLRISTPVTPEQKREFHRQFNGSKDNIKKAVAAHLNNSIKASGPIMSASENQASRKSEFNTVIQDQLNDGLYDMRRVQVDSDQLDDKGNKIKVWATEIQRDDKLKPRVTSISPLKAYGITVSQFSITSTDYDEQTRKQFSTKKEAFLKAESAKAEREGEVQQRLMIEEKGLREKAETEALANRSKAEAVIKAEKEKEVAELEADKISAVAMKTKEAAETKARQMVEVAKLDLEAARAEAAKTLLLADAEKERIAKAGAITETARFEIQARQETAIGVATALSRLQSPQVVMAGGSGGTTGANAAGGGSSQSELISLFLLQKTGLLDGMRQVKEGSPSASNN